ncbi:MAG: 2-oxo acid dehydrogenase subunit E2 [Anaerolineaceae bacterium]|nr:2-oxo acid dehydrogenase subunit E2 [Anaerolineaceae bacterium]
MNAKQETKTVLPYPRIRQLMVDGGQMGLKKHTIHGLVEFDITRARELIRQYRLKTGKSLSFSVFFLACLGRALDEHKEMHAYRSWRNQLVIFDEVDVNMLFEVEVDGQKVIRPYILRGVNHKSLGELQQEVEAFQAGHAESQESKFIDWFVRLPGFIRRATLKALFKHPQWIKDYYGTVILSSVGMFGKGSGWGIPVPNHTLQITLGGMSEKPGVARGKIEIREYMSVTISMDHDIIDGAPAARFLQRLKKLVERGEGLAELLEAETEPLVAA